MGRLSGLAYPARNLFKLGLGPTSLVLRWAWALGYWPVVPAQPGLVFFNINYFLRLWAGLISPILLHDQAHISLSAH